ncbi:Fragile site folic acid type rare candidate 1 [Fasciolopsis buskii]|uniref:Fragile site folic acid type rare candidate 1 n=1 Tax=Fasciolopsis buskii TaxID=27845 RepID=A0A8E0S089_9TREM|nr:Fragile site folic acid type rare candidate 1 [Fasciolopsis buski]
MFLGCTMAKNFTELFPSEEYISDYESETASNADTGNTISASEIRSLHDQEFSASVQKPRFPAYGDAKSAWDSEQRRTHNLAARHQLLSMDAYDRHRKLVNDYLQFYGGSWKDFQRDTSSDRRDIDVIREYNRFLWSEKDEPASWSERLAKRYWDKLFKEYCLVDLSRYKEDKFGMRWRLEKEVISGKGQFTCGSVHCAATGSAGEGRLRSWEVNFAYKERGERRNALVKLRLCPACSDKLNYRHKRREITGSKVTPKTKQPSSEQSSGNSSTLTSASTAGSPRVSHTSESTDEIPSKRNRYETDTGSKNDRSTKDLNAVWCASSAQTNSSSGIPKSLNDEFDEYFADMLL